MWLSSYLCNQKSMSKPKRSDMQQQKKRQKMMQQMAFDYLRLLADYELLEQLDKKDSQKTDSEEPK